MVLKDSRMDFYGHETFVLNIQKPVSRAGDIITKIIESKKIGDIYNCWGSTIVEVIYSTNAITAKQKN